MLVVILLGRTRVWTKMPTVFALVGVASGLVSAYLLNRERHDAEGSALMRLTGWFWLGLFSSLVVAISALVSYLKRSKPT